MAVDNDNKGFVGAEGSALASAPASGRRPDLLSDQRPEGPDGLTAGAAGGAVRLRAGRLRRRVRPVGNEPGDRQDGGRRSGRGPRSPRSAGDLFRELRPAVIGRATAARDPDGPLAPAAGAGGSGIAQTAPPTAATAAAPTAATAAAPTAATAGGRPGGRLRLAMAPALIAAAMAAAVLALSAPPARACCAATESTAAEAMADARLRYEERDAFPSPEETRRAWESCLSGLESYGIVLAPDLIPMPDLGELTERLCRQTRAMVMDRIPEIVPSFGPSPGVNRMVRNPALADELSRALR